VVGLGNGSGCFRLGRSYQCAWAYKKGKKANRQQQRQRLADRLRAVERLDRSFNDVGMAGLRSAEAHQAQILFPRQRR
jgi:hypothetical protein